MVYAQLSRDLENPINVRIPLGKSRFQNLPVAVNSCLSKPSLKLMSRKVKNQNFLNLISLLVKFQHR